MPSFTLRERFHRIRQSWSKDTPSSRPSTTEKGDGRAPPPYVAVESSSPQTVHPSFTRVSRPARPPVPIERILESRKRIGDELARLMMNPTSTVQWAKHNPFRNGDRLRNFLYHCLLWQYYVHPVPQPKLSEEDERHFILLCRFVSEWYHYNTHQKKNISDDDEFLNHVKKCVWANVNDPIEKILHLEVPHVFDTMRAWVDEFGKHYSGP